MAKPPRKKPGPRPPVDHEQLLQWVERIATHLAVDGMPPIAGRILGWLMICDPAQQAAEEIADAIGASRASLTTNLRILTMMGLVSRQSRPGNRTVFYGVDEGAWEGVVRRQIASLSALDAIIDDGLDLVGRDGTRARRMVSAHETFAWMTEVFENAPPLPSGRRWSERKD
jgi:DNA-binding transcriptional ArsR family regulator